MQVQRGQAEWHVYARVPQQPVLHIRSAALGAEQGRAQLNLRLQPFTLRSAVAAESGGVKAGCRPFDYYQKCDV